MMQFLKLETEYAYEIAWQFLLGYLYEPHQQGAGLTPAQLAHLLDKMQQFAAAKSPDMAGQMAEYKQQLDQVPAAAPSKPTTQPDDPTTWPEATWNEVKQYKGEVHRFTRAESGRLLKAALSARWPGIKFSLKTDTYGLTTVSYVETRNVGSRDVRALAMLFNGTAFDGATDSRYDVHRWRDTPQGRQLVQHGISSTSIQAVGRQNACSARAH